MSYFDPRNATDVEGAAPGSQSTGNLALENHSFANEHRELASQPDARADARALPTTLRRAHEEIVTGCAAPAPRQHSGSGLPTRPALPAKRRLEGGDTNWATPSRKSNAFGAGLRSATVGPMRLFGTDLIPRARPPRGLPERQASKL